MFSLVHKRRWFFLLSALVIVPGLVVMLISLFNFGAPFRLGIDFQGGTIYELRFTERPMTEAELQTVFSDALDATVQVQRLGAVEENRWSVRGPFTDDATNQTLLSRLDALAGLDRSALRIEGISETVGQEVALAAVGAIVVASVVVTGFIVIAFRQVPNAFRYGVCAILAMIHDVLVVSSLMSLAGVVLGWEADALFLTALLTVVGFSVQDTIVLFDRIRENIPLYLGEPYETIVNRSILETIHRSLATQLNAFFIMIAILLFGGETIRQFIAILFVGLLTGTYSSIFIAVPLLVAWEKGELPLVGRFSKTALAVSGAGDWPSD